jgi:glycosyltransferase A (GT-A) superfamily protein (DUF2064 family)
MAKRDKPGGPRPEALILERSPWQPALAGDALARALREDLTELISSMRLRVGRAEDADQVATIHAREDRPLLLAFPDVPALPPLSVEGALSELRQHAAVLGPTVDGGVYLLGFAPGLDSGVVAALARAALEERSLEQMCDLLDDSELPVATLPPWFRIQGANELSFAEHLARLSLLSEDGEEDFLADRLRLWFEQNADEHAPA